MHEDLLETGVLIARDANRMNRSKAAILIETIWRRFASEIGESGKARRMNLSWFVFSPMRQVLPRR